MTGWFEKLAVSGTIIGLLQVGPWGATDGQVLEQFGLRWLTGFEE